MAKKTNKAKAAAKWKKIENSRKRKNMNSSPAAGPRLLPPENGVTVRMYRTGHGDCFLLAFAGETADKPAYVLIDCGYKPGSPQHITTKIADITKNIREATGGHLHVAVITHEHQDHVNGITEANFAGITIGETWLAWTEDSEDGLANSLRMTFKDKLLGLFRARNKLAASGDAKQVRRIDEFLDFELGGDSETDPAPTPVTALAAAGGDPANSMNKRSMKLFKDRAQNGVKYIRPHERIFGVPGAKNVRVYALGPPRDTAQIKDLDPQGEETFQRLRLAASAETYFTSATSDGGSQPPFANRYWIALVRAHADPAHGAFFVGRYGREGTPTGFAPGTAMRESDEAHDNPDWRRIDNEWLYSAEQLALDMNGFTNNSSLVLAFELGKDGKVLLFAADAQRGNWVSWAKEDWKDGDAKVTARDLLSRTVLYKVGHHGSHNATLDGPAQAETPNLAWMASGEYSREFTTMVTAVRSWAETQKGWDHPLKSIKETLLKKASGRVFQTDTDFDRMKMPDNASKADWESFQSRARGDRLYFDYTVIG
jgi:beta-lactamase superfamily II metal-dependent hydrolase